MNDEAKLLQRYLDGELSPSEAAEFRSRLEGDPELQRELLEMQTLGELVRAWAVRSEARADGLLAPTLARVRAAEQRRARHAGLGVVTAALLLFALPWADGAPSPLRAGLLSRPLPVRGAAIERLEAGSVQARVFVVGSAETPVVWLADDADGDDGFEQQDPG